MLRPHLIMASTSAGNNMSRQIEQHFTGTSDVDSQGTTALNATSNTQAKHDINSATAPNPNLPGTPCTSCGSKTDKNGKALSRCARCKLRSYCSKDCQKKHWPEHKAECKAAQTKQRPVRSSEH